MKHIYFIASLLRSKFVMSGMRVGYDTPDSQPTVNRRSRLTSQQRHYSVTSARVAQEWLKYAAMAVMLFTIGIGNVWGADPDESVTFSAQGYSNQQAVSSYNGTDFSIAFDKGSNSNAPKYFTNGTAIRAYGGNTMTISSSTKTIEKIVITFGSSDGSNAISTDVATYSNGTWTGSATSVTFTIGGSTGNRRLSAIAITYASSGGGGGGGSSKTFHLKLPTGQGNTYVDSDITDAEQDLLAEHSTVISEKLCYGEKAFWGGSWNSGYWSPTKILYADRTTTMPTRYNKDSNIPDGTTLYPLYVEGSPAKYHTDPYCPSYSVYYDGNGNTGGTVPTDDENYDGGETVTVKSATLTKTNYTFTGWNTKTDGTGTHYAASGSATFTMPAENVYLYAEWCRDLSTITSGDFDLEASSITATSARVDWLVDGATKYDIRIADNSTWASATYQYSENNSTSTDITRTDLQPNTQYWVSINAKNDCGSSNKVKTINFTTLNAYDITYHKNDGGSDVTKVEKKTEGQNYTISSDAFSRDYYTLSKWHTLAAGTGGTDYAKGATYSTDAALELYAVWAPAVYTVTKSFTGCTSASMPTSYTYTGSANDFSYTVTANSGKTLPSTISITMGGAALTAGTDYTWNSSTGALAISKIITGNLVITISSLTLYTVTFYNAAGSAPVAVTQTTEGGTVSIPSTTACDDWDFAGWKIGSAQSETTTDPTGSGYVTSESWPTTYTPDGNKSFYAVFKKTTGGGAKTTLLTSDFEADADATNWPTNSGTYREEQDGSNTLRFSAKSSTGSITSKSLSASVGTTVYVKFDIKDYGDASTQAIVSVSDVAASESFATDSYTSFTSVTKSFVTTKTPFTVTIASSGNKKRFYIDNIEIYYGGGGTTTWKSDVSCSSAALDHISITSNPTKLNYLVGQVFDPTGAVVEAYYDDDTHKTISPASITWEPTLGLSAGTNQTITASYTEGGVTKTDSKNVLNVYTSAIEKRDEDGTLITADRPTVSITSLINLNAEEHYNNYVFKEWQITNGTLSSSAETRENNTIATVSGNVTVTAVYYKPVTVTWYVNGNGSTNIYHTDTHARGWNLTYPTDPDPDDYSCGDKLFIGWTSTFPYSSESVAPTFVSSGTAINSNQSYYAVFADQTVSGTPPTWTKTALSSVSTGGTYLICTDDGHVFNGTISSGHGQITASAFPSFKANSTFNVDAPLGSCELTFAAVTNGFTMYSAGNGYLYCTASTAGHIAWNTGVESNYWFYKTSHWRYSGAKDGSGNETAIWSYDNQSFRNYVSSALDSNKPIVLLKKTDSGTPAVYSNYATSCACEGYSFHTGTGTDNEVKATNTRTCFTQVNSSTTWTIENYAIPADTEFFVGYQEEFKDGTSGHELGTSSRSSVQTWAAEMYLENMKTNGDGSRPTVGQATGAVGTLSIWSDNDWNNCHVGFQPNGYGITYTDDSNNFGFTATGTANKLETDVVTLPDVSSTEYTMGLATATDGVYVTCGHSSAAEPINAMGVSINTGGKKKILLVPGSFNADGAVYAVWDGTNSTWGDGTTKLLTDADDDGVWEGFVAASCTSINLVRLSSGTTASNIDWDRKWNQTANITIGDLLQKYTITSLSGDACTYTTTAMHPAMGERGKFRMWDNSTSKNWYVHFVPYYRLSYNPYGGQDEPSPSDDVPSEGNVAARTIEISSTEPTKDGYRFMGWATSTDRSDAGTVDYKYGTENDEVVLTDNMTLYAVWVPTYTVTYNLDGGSASPVCSGGSYIQGETVTVCTTTPTKAGAEFDGWTYSPSVAVTTGTFTMPASNVTITATWVDTEYDLIHSGSNYDYSANPTKIKSGDTSPSGKTLTYTCSSSYGFPSDVTITGGGKATWTKGTHYTWTVAGNKQSATLVINQTTITADVTIAITMATTYTVTYVHHDKGTFSGGSTTQSVLSNDNTITLPTVTSVSCGDYDTFEGWIASNSEYAESSDKPATVYAGGGSYTVTGNVTLRALYSYEDPDATGYTKITSGVTAGKYLIVTDGGVAYAGKSGSNSYGAYENVTVSSGTISSKGDATEVTISMSSSNFHMNDGTYYLGYSGSSNDLKFNTTVSDDRDLWKLDANGQIESVNVSGRKLEYNSGSPRFACYTGGQTDAFLYRKGGSKYCTNPSCATPTQVTVTYDANGGGVGSITCSGATLDYGTYPALDEDYTICNTFSRAGYTLYKWSTRADGIGGTDYAPGEVVGPTHTHTGFSGESVTLYAQWRKKVSFNIGNATGSVADVVDTDGDGNITLPGSTGITSIPCEYVFYGWRAGSVDATTTKPSGILFAGDTYDCASATLYAVYRLAGDASVDPNLFSLSYTYSGTKYYVSYPKSATADAATQLVGSTNSADAAAFGVESVDFQTFKAWYYMNEGAKEYIYWYTNDGTSIRHSSTKPTDKGWNITDGVGTKRFVPSNATTRNIGFNDTPGDPLFRPYTDNTDALTIEEVSATSYTYATSPNCSTTATLAFVTNGGTLNYPDGYDADNYVDLTVGTDVYLPTASFSGEWVFDGWMKGSALPSQATSPAEDPNFYEVTLNTTTYTASPSGTTTFYAVFSKTVNDKQWDPSVEGTYKIFAIMSDGTTRRFMPTWGGTQTTLNYTTACPSAGDYTITPGTGDHEGQYKITHSTYTLGVVSDSDTKFKNVSDAWWNIEPSTSGKGTYRFTIVGSSERCLCYSGFETFGNYTRSQVNSPTQPNYRDLEIGECIYTEYTSTPENVPYITITGSPVKITSTSGERVYAPTKLHIEAHNFSTTRTIHFSATNGFATNPASVTTEANGAYSGDIDIYYQPTTDGDGSIVSSVLTASQIAGPAAERVSQTFSAIRGRNMPANFVIAAKVGEQWYAMPDDKSTTEAVTAVPIEVNDPDAPTAASLVPHNVEWSLSDVVNSNDRPKDKVYFYETNKMKDDGITPWHYALYAGSAPTIGTYGQVSGISGTSSDGYEWGLTTSDLCAYTISNAKVGKNISINTSGNFGTHAASIASSTLYLLPITAYYETAQMQVLEWKANSVVIMYTGTQTTATTKVGENAASSSQTLSSQKLTHGIYELTTKQALTANAGQPLKISFGDDAEVAIVTIPIIINSEVTANANHASEDVIIVSGGKLIAAATNYNFHNIYVYGGGKLKIASGSELGVNNIILRAGGVTTNGSGGSATYAYVYPQVELGGTLTSTQANIKYEYVTDYDHWYHLCLPFNALTGTITYPTEYYGDNVTANNTGSWIIKRYAGEIRATGNNNAWVDIESTGEPTPTTVTAGHGYIFWGAPKKVSVGGATKQRQQWGIQRITMSVAAAAATTAETADKTIGGLSSYKDVEGKSSAVNDQGWNLIGNPFMVNLTGLSSTSLKQGLLEKEYDANNNWTGQWKFTGNGNRYITVPSNHFDTYEAVKVNDETVTLTAGRTFFVQIEENYNAVLFDKDNRAAMAPAWQRNAEADQVVDVETGIVMSNAELSDEVDFWIKDGKTEAYESNADYPKTHNTTDFNIYGVHPSGNLSWVAISPSIAEGDMAIGYQVPQAGDYILSLSEKFNAGEIESLLVTDHGVAPELTTDLMINSYLFTVHQAETNNERFTVSIKVREQGITDVTTDIGGPITAPGDTPPVKFIYDDKLYILNHGILYDATGKRVNGTQQVTIK